LTGLAAWQTLFELAEYKPGRTDLVKAAGGAVGSLVVRLAARTADGLRSRRWAAYRQDGRAYPRSRPVRR
ncbi:hypothetical protein ACFVHN_32825, partial [Streptomyces sp. NPDC127164]